MDDTHKYRLFGGAKGGGKSRAFRMEAVKQCTAVDELRMLCLRRTNPEIRENMIVPLQRELPNSMFKLNSQEGIMRFRKTASTIWFTYCQSIADVMRFQGMEFDGIGIEELTQWTEEEFKILAGCLRTSREGIRPNFFGTANPGGIGHGWVKRLWIDREFSEDEDPNEYSFIPAKITDNPILMRIDPQYVKSLHALPDKLRRAYLHGDWDVFEGQYFDDFRRDIHVIKPFIPTLGVKRRIISFDYGYSKPSAVYWMCQMMDDSIIIYRELYVTKHTYGMLAKKIKALTTEEEKIDFIVCDPSIVKKESESNASTAAADFKAEGLVITGANNSRVPRWNTYRDYLKPYRDPNSGELTARLKITENCRNLIRTLPKLVHDDKNPEDLNTKGEDHPADGSGYGIVTLDGGGSSLSEVKSMNQQFMKNNGKSDRDKRDEKQGVTKTDNILIKKW